MNKEIVTFQMNKSDKDDLKKEAEEKGLSLSDIIRLRLNGQLR